MYFNKWQKFFLVVIALCFITLMVLLVIDIKAENVTEELERIEEVDGLEETNEESPDAFAVAMNSKRDYLILVNERKPYEFGGKYDKMLQNDLIWVSDTDGVPTPVEKGAYLAFSMLKAELLNRFGINIELYSAYRTEEDQDWVYRHYTSIEGGEARNIALPGCSEHHTGLVIDFHVRRHGEWVCETEEMQTSDSYYEPIRELLADYGFIERYPAGKELITGIICEPNEIRFVGSSATAHKIMDDGLCLEEYLHEWAEG